MRGKKCRLINEKGQTAVEYMMITLALVVAFSGMFGFMQGQLRHLFTVAGKKILTAYY